MHLRKSLDSYLVATILVLVGTVMYNRIVRVTSIPREMRYMPQDVSLIVSSGDIVSIWNSFDVHFGSAIRSDGNSFLAGVLADLQGELYENRGLRIRSIKDIEAYGINVDRGIIFGLRNVAPYLPGSESAERGFILIIPINPSREQEVKDLLYHWSGDQLMGLTKKKIKGADSIYRFGEYLLTFPESNVALVSDSFDLLRKALRDPNANFNRLLADDDLFEVIRRDIRGLVGKGSAVLVHHRGETLSPFRSADAVINFEKLRIQVIVDLKLPGKGIDIIEQFLTPYQSSGTESGLPAKTFLSATFQDVAIERLLVFFSRIDGFDRYAKKCCGGLFSELRTVPSINKVKISLIGFREGLPDILFGIEADHDSLEEVIRRVRMNLREERDIRILDEVVRRHYADEVNTRLPTVERMLNDGHLKEEDGGALELYKFNTANNT